MTVARFRVAGHLLRSVRVIGDTYWGALMKPSSVTRAACGVVVSLGTLVALQAGAIPAGAASARVSSVAPIATSFIGAHQPAQAVPVPTRSPSVTTQIFRGAAVAPAGTSLTSVQRYSMVPMRRPGTPAVNYGVLGTNSIPCAITCSEIHMSYFGGPVLSDAEVEGVFWDASGNYTQGAAPGGEMPAFYNAIGRSDWWGGLSEYNTNGLNPGTDQYIGPVSSLGETTITPSAGDNGSTITDAEMKTELAAQITAGSLPYPAVDSTGNVKTVYALYFPDNKTVCIVTGECNTNAFCAYHNSFSYGGLDVPYMVLPAFTPGSADASGCGTLPTITDDFTSAVSHELVEATTDTGIGLDTSNDYAYPAGWADNNNNAGEIMDACDTSSSSPAPSSPAPRTTSRPSGATRKVRVSSPSRT